MESAAGPPPKKQATDHLVSFLHDVEVDEKFSEQLMKVRKGPPPARKQSLKDLSETSDPAKLIEVALPMFSEPGLDASERSRLIKLLCRLLQKQKPLGSASPIAAVTEQLLELVRRLLNSKDSAVQQNEARPLLLSLTQVVGMKTFISALRPSFVSDDDNTRQSNASSIAIAAQTFGLTITLPLIRVLVKSELHNEQLLGLLIVQRLPRYTGRAILPFLQDLVGCCVEALKDPSLSTSSNGALSMLAEAVSPFGIEAFEQVMEPLWAGARKRRGRAKIAFLRTLASLLPLTDADSVHELGDPVIQFATDIFYTDASVDNDQPTTTAGPVSGADIRRDALRVASKCVKYVSEDALAEFLPKFFSRFWHEAASADRRTASLVVWTSIQIPVSHSDLVTRLVESNSLSSNCETLQLMALELMAKLDPDPLVLNHRIEQRLMDGLVAAYVSVAPSEVSENTGLVEVNINAAANEVEEPNPTDKPAKPVSPSYILAISVYAVRNALSSLPADRIEVYSRMWVSLLLERDSNPSPIIRQTAIRTLASVIPLLPRPSLSRVLKRLYEELGEEYPEVLGEVINALRTTLESLQPDEGTQMDPPLSQLLPRLTPILRNRNERVQESCIKLIHTILDLAGEDISAREWMQICFELLELQKSHRQQVRYEATATFAAISSVVGPADVVATLLSHLRSPDRQFRVTTAAAIASIAKETGSFTVLPVLLNEYSSGETVIQHGVLKALSFLFQFVDSINALPYINSVVTLIDDALVDRNQVHRQTAASIVHYMAKTAAGCGKEALFIHFLNELMPSIFETSPHVIDRVVEAISSIRELIGVGAFSNYIWAGLFHPARKVRNVYWKFWNSMYFEEADAIVPVYPLEIEDPIGRTQKNIRDLWF